MVRLLTVANVPPPAEELVKGLGRRGVVAWHRVRVEVVRRADVRVPKPVLENVGVGEVRHERRVAVP